jgi:hypothetical protein
MTLLQCDHDGHCYSRRQYDISYSGGQASQCIAVAGCPPEQVAYIYMTIDAWDNSVQALVHVGNVRGTWRRVHISFNAFAACRFWRHEIND